MRGDMIKKKRCAKVLIFLITVVIMTACAVCFSACNTGSTADTLIVGTTTVIDTLNRLDAGGGRPGYAYTMLSSTLAQIPLAYRSGGEYSSLLFDISNSDDGLDWTFNLKDGFYWHDGVAVSADDVKYTLCLFYKSPSPRD